MARAVVCISATDGAGGEPIGPLVASELGFRVVDEEVVARAAREAGVADHVAADAERRKSLVERIVERLPSTAAAAGSPLAGYTPIAPVDASPGGDELRGLIRSAIEELASQGQAVIVSHAASLALAGREDTLRVLVTGSDEARAARIAAASEVSEEEAQKLRERGDANRADYIKRFYGVGQEGPTHYDLVVSTDRIGAEQAAALIAAAARS